jgi:hypothetical protein
MARNAQKLDEVLPLCLSAYEGGDKSISSILDDYLPADDPIRQQVEAALWLEARKKSLAPRPGYVRSSRQYVTDQIQKGNVDGILAGRISWISQLQDTWQMWQMKQVLQFASISLLILTIFAFSNVLSLAARLSIPGDSLYPVKLGIEQLQLAFTLSDAGDTELYLEFSKQRTTEIVDLILEGQYEYLPGTAANLEHQVNQAIISLEGVAEKDAMLAKTMETSLENTLDSQVLILAVLHGTSPPPARPGIELAMEVTTTGLSALLE